MTSKYLLLLLSFFFTISIYSQNILSGKIKDSANNPISNANVSFKSLKGSGLLDFDITDVQGHFKLKINPGLDSIKLTVSHLSFEPLVKIISTKDYEYIFTLKNKVDALKEIVIKSPPPIYKKRDTINYMVNAFSDSNDKSIRDIIEKLPGIEMDGDKILYNNRPIQKFYINGLDMLGGKYSLANENLPAEAVKSVQVVENDQPVKILDSLVFSDRASLNLKLEKDITITGTGRAGIGATPLSWSANITPMLFEKNRQALGSYQSNNIGENIEKQLEDLTIEDGQKNSKKNFVDLIGVTPPPIEGNRWIFNNVNFVSANFIKKFDNEFEVKGGFSFLNNNIEQSANSELTIFAGEREIQLVEDINTFQNRNVLKGNLTLHQNKKNLYFENNLSIDHEVNEGTGAVVSNNTDVFQNQNDTFTNLENDLDLKTFIGSRLIQFNSSSHYSTSPQSLKVIYKDSARAIQTVNFKDWETKNSASFIERFSDFTVTPEVGVVLKKETLGSHLQEEIADDSEVNRNQISKTSTFPYIKLGTQFNTDRINVTLNLPFKTATIKLMEGSTTNNEVKRLLFLPDIKFNYDLNSKWSLRFGSSYNQIFSQIDQLYGNPILTNYRNIQNFPSDLRGTEILDSYMFSSFKNPLKGSFIDLSLSYLERFRDFTPSYTINNNGYYRFNLIDSPSQQSTIRFNSNLGKFFRSFKTVLKLKNSAGYSSSVEFLDSKINDIENYTYSTGLQLNNTSLDWLVVDFEGRFLYSSKSIEGNERSFYSLQEYNFDLSVVPFENHMISLNQNYTINQFQNTSSSYFADLIYEVQVPKWDVEIELGLQNLFNETEYITLSNTDFTVVENVTYLRPRLFFVSLDFKF